jgi:hypothetical protein
MLAGKTTSKAVPHAPDEWVEFRTISAAELDEAEERQMQRSLSMVKGLDAEQMRAASSDERRREVRDEDKYDKETLVKYGVHAWSLEVECNEENKRLLDAQTREWMVGEIIAMNLRPFGSGSDSTPAS